MKLLFLILLLIAVTRSAKYCVDELNICASFDLEEGGAQVSLFRSDGSDVLFDGLLTSPEPEFCYHLVHGMFVCVGLNNFQERCPYIKTKVWGRGAGDYQFDCLKEKSLEKDMANYPKLLNLTAEDIQIIYENPFHVLTIPCKGELRLKTSVTQSTLSHVHPLHYIDEVDEAAIPISWAPRISGLDESSPGYKYIPSCSEKDGIIVSLDVARWLSRTCHPGKIFSVPTEKEKIVDKAFRCLNLHSADYS